MNTKYKKPYVKRTKAERLEYYQRMVLNLRHDLREAEANLNRVAQEPDNAEVESQDWSSALAVDLDRAKSSK